MSDDLLRLPTGLPVPVDDGRCDHLAGMAVADIPLVATTGAMVDLSGAGRAVVYCYPRTGGPMWAPPLEWDDIPGALAQEPADS